MGVVRAEPAKVTDWAAKATGTAWRAFDLQLTTYALLLSLIGLAMAYSYSSQAGQSAIQVGSTFARGLLWTGIALLVFLTATAFDYKWLKNFAWPIYAFQLALLGVTLLVGSGVGSAARWVPILGIQFQFSEIAKILMIVVLANYLTSSAGRSGSLASILGACLLALPPVVLVMLQPDLGTSLVFGAILLGMLFISGASLRWLGALLVGAIAVFPWIWTNALHDYQRARLIAFLNPSLDTRGVGFQLNQSQIAVGSGNWFGVGLTNGTASSSGYLPVGTTDFVFAKLAEELGFVGGIVVFVLFVTLIWRILVSGWRSHDRFGTVFAAGVGSMILFQLVVNVGMVVGVMPITGIPLPFVTHGGASLISTAAGLGILQSINIRQTRAEW
jgi:rod shape determining protein RodA